jgi:predicted 3-demethylubiquinone-9 3-methyltransferase (glyoxalase superfamily)
VQKITTFLWFDNQAEEAAKFYVSIFKNSKIKSTSPMVTEFTLDGVEFMALNGGPLYKFTEAVSLYISCEDQAEVDELWDKLLAGGGQESQCGWLKDKYGLSWQVTPKLLPKLIGSPDRVKADRAMQAMLKMKKIDCVALQKAYNGE